MKKTSQIINYSLGTSNQSPSSSAKPNRISHSLQKPTISKHSQQCTQMYYYYRTYLIPNLIDLIVYTEELLALFESCNEVSNRLIDEYIMIKVIAHHPIGTTALCSR